MSFKSYSLMNFNIDTIIEKLWESREFFDNGSVLSKKEIKFLCNEVMEVFKSQPVCLELTAPISICGDIHGQFDDLCRIFETNGRPDSQSYLFLGDYVDRGENSISTICLLFAYKVKYPDTFFLLRGNHESAMTNRDYGFKGECLTRYSNTIYTLFNTVFNWLPLVAIVDSSIFCVHGGISPEMKNIEDIKKIQRPLEIPDEGLICDLLWSDPDSISTEWGPSSRQTSVCYGQKAVESVINKFKFNLIVRSHQSAKEGYSYPFAPYKSVLTVFSAPNYQNQGNPGAVLNISNTLDTSFTFVKPFHRYNSNYEFLI